MRPFPHVALAALLALASCSREPRPFVVASRPGTESEVAAEMIAAMIEAGLRVPVKRKRDLTPKDLFAAVKVGDADAIAEDAGRAAASLAPSDRRAEEPAAEEGDAQLLARLRGEFERRWGVVWLDPLGPRPSFALAMRAPHARALEAETISELAALGRGLRCAFEPEFADRPDGYRAVTRDYEADLCSSISHKPRAAVVLALRDGRADLGSARSTDGAAQALDLAALEDDRAAMRRYPVSILLSAKTERRFPGSAAMLKRLSGRLSDADLSALVAKVDLEQAAPKEAARTWLRERGLLP